MQTANQVLNQSTHTTRRKLATDDLNHQSACVLVWPEKYIVPFSFSVYAIGRKQKKLALTGVNNTVMKQTTTH